MLANTNQTKSGISERIRQLLAVAQEALNEKDLVSAERHALDAIRLADDFHGPDHAEMAVPYSVLSVIYHDYKKFPQAELCAQNTMEILINSNQGDTILAARTQVILASSLCMQRKTEGVGGLFESAISLLRKHVGEHSLEMLMALNSQAVAYIMTGYAADAEKIFNKLYRLLGDSSPAYGLSKCDVLINIGLCAFTQGDIGRAIGFAEMALSNALCFHEKDYSKIATIHGLLFNINVSRNDSIAAQAHGREMLDIVEQHNVRHIDAETIKDARNFVASADCLCKEDAV